MTRHLDKGPVAGAWAVVASTGLAVFAAAWLLLAPQGESRTEHRIRVSRLDALPSQAPPRKVAPGETTLFGQYGGRLAFILLVPVALSALPLFLLRVGAQRARPIRSAAAIGLIAFVLLALPSVGLFFLPSAAAMIAAAVIAT